MLELGAKQGIRLEAISREFDFRQDLTEEGEIDEKAASTYIEELSRRFAESPEGEALAGRGGEPGHYLYLFLDYSLRNVGVSPAEMDASDVRETLEVMARFHTALSEDFDQAIPELEAFCDFVGRGFAFEKAAAWKRAIQNYAAEFRRAIRDPRRWGMAKSMMMEGLSRGYDLSTEKGLDQWFRTNQAEQIAKIEAGLAPGGTPLWDRLRRIIGLGPAEGVPAAGRQGTGKLFIGDIREPELAPGFGAPSKRERKNEKSGRKQAKASRRRSRRLQGLPSLTDTPHTSWPSRSSPPRFRAWRRRAPRSRS